MRVHDKLVKEVVSEVVGEDVLPLIAYLKGKRNISEFTIAESIDIEVNEARNMLYRLHGMHLVTYHRKKDKEKGWYISYWTFNPSRVVELKDRLHLERVAALKERLRREEQNLNAFFICTSMCSRLEFERAMEYDFKCPECGTLMTQQDNSKTIEHLRARIQDLGRSGAVRTG
ncbi:hypothetical protein J4439_08200 [Candidatus Woesearchaeota archaeon]|nr:hypothetical protein [Candidatus Woesearchaeota archaeon]